MTLNEPRELPDRGKGEIETLKTVLAYPRFTIQVRGETAKVTRFGTDDDDRTYFEVSDELPPVFPQHYGYIKNGAVFVQHNICDEDAQADAEMWYECIGKLEESKLCPGEGL